MPMYGDEYHPTAKEARRDRERTVDPQNWVNCETCSGTGVTYSGGANNPDATEHVCHDCDGAGGYEWACEECGCAVLVDDYDCIICDTVGALPAEGFDHAAIAKSMASALNDNGKAAA